MSLVFRRTCLLVALLLLAALVPLAQTALAASIVVANVNDSGVGSLRAAITSANSTAGADTITFAIATPQPWTITLLSPLPTLTDNSTTIDGTFPAGGTAPKVEIKGAALKGSGILIHSSNNTVRGLILNGFIKDSASLDFGGAGITISGSSTSGVAANNVIEYNYIGTDAAGSAMGQTPSLNNNEMAGVLLISGASNNIIRNNVISGNRGPGVYLTTDRGLTESFSKTGNIIRDNIIGLKADGTAALPNAYGVWVAKNSDSTVVGPGNTISGNGNQAAPGSQPYGYGVFVQYDNSIILTAGVFYPRGTVVKGNKIGTNPAGTAALPNKDGGVLVGVSTNTTIGGANATDPNERNLISGSFNLNSFGVALEDYPLDNTRRTTGAVVQNNWIGLDATGAATLPNRVAGVLLRENIGGARIGPGNVISGNGSSASGAPTTGGIGVQVLVTSTNITEGRQASGNEISGNLIGSNAAGTAGFTNQSYGISLKGDTSANVIKNNTISFNQLVGVNVEPNGANAPHGNTIQDNQIGTTAGGGTPGNGTVGIQLLGASNVIGPGNVIAGHTSSGVAIASASNTVKGNAIRNNQIGIQITGAVTGNLIGGSSPSDGNAVTNNTADGISITGAGTIGNKISHTTTNANGGKGIALTTGGNAPIAAASLSVTQPIVGLTLTGSATGCTGGCTIEIFTDDNALVDEGPTFLPTTPLTGINGAFSVDITGCKHYLIFTLTDSAGNTSEFLSPTAFIPQCVPSAPIVTLSPATPAASQGALPNASVIFQHTVSNTGTAPGVLTITTSSSNGWTVVLNKSACPVGPATLAAGASCNITLTVTVPAGTPPGDVNTTTITAALAGATVTDQKTDTTTALSAPALTFTPLAQAKTVGSGQPVTYQHKLTNTGNGPDSFDITVTPPSGWTFTVQPSSPIQLGQGSSITVTVVLTPPPATAANDYAATVRAASHSAASVFQDAVDTTTIQAAAVPKISSVVTPPTADQSAMVTVAYTVTNVGNIDGTFNLIFTPPAGWTVTQAAPASVLVPFSGPPATFNVILQVPGSAIAGDYGLALIATATTAPNAQATKTDTVTVNQKAGLQLAPTFSDPILRPPNTTITYTEQLTNTGNFTDAISLAATTNTAGWIVRTIPLGVTLNPGASAPIAVVLTIPLGQLAGVSNTTTVTATSSLPAVFRSAQITTTIDNVSGALLTPQVPQAKVIDAGKPITFTYTLVNSGSISQSYTLTQSGAPGGWISTLTPASPTAMLAPGATQAITLVLQAPAGTPDNTKATVIITAACVEKTCTPATATALLTIGPPFSVGAGGNCNGPALPGALVTCVHTIINTGFSADTYLVSVISPLGWSTSVAPAIVSLAAGSSSLVTITLAVPSSADAGLQHLLTVTPRSTALPSVSQTLTDTTTVLQVGGISFSPSRTAPTVGGQLLQFQHTLLNTGNGLDTYTITATQNLNWNITIVPTTTSALPRGTYQTIQVSIQVPPGATTVVTNRITLRATSKFTPAASEQLVDTIGTFNFPGRVYFTYLPIQR